MSIVHGGGSPYANLIPMTQPLDFDLLAPAELLTYLVVSQLTAHHTNGEWLKVEDLITSAQRWLRSNGGNMTCRQLANLALRAQHLAADVERTSEMTFNETTTASMYFDGLRLDFRSPAVVDIFLICAGDLNDGSPFMGMAGTDRQ